MNPASITQTAYYKGKLPDIVGSWQRSYILTVACELIVLSYALFGSQQRPKNMLGI